MTHGFRADPERLAAQAGEFDDIVGRVSAIHRTLSERLAAAGPCWGGDAVGQSFAGTHVGSADATLGKLSGLTDQLGGVGTRFAGTAAGYTGLDDGVRRDLGRVDPDA